MPLPVSLTRRRHTRSPVRNAAAITRVLRVTVGIDRQVDEHRSISGSPQSVIPLHCRFPAGCAFFQHGTVYIHTGQCLHRVNDAHLNIAEPPL